jgi:hypothetical protein
MEDQMGSTRRMHGKNQNCEKILVGKHEGTISLLKDLGKIILMLILILKWIIKK